MLKMPGSSSSPLARIDATTNPPSLTPIRGLEKSYLARRSSGLAILCSGVPPVVRACALALLRLGTHLRFRSPVWALIFGVTLVQISAFPLGRHPGLNSTVSALQFLVPTPKPQPRRSSALTVFHFGAYPSRRAFALTPPVSALLGLQAPAPRPTVSLARVRPLAPPPCCAWARLRAPTG